MPKTKKTSKRKPNPAFMKPVQPDDKLAAVVGSYAAITAGAYKKALGIHQEARSAGQKEKNHDQRRRRAQAGI